MRAKYGLRVGVIAVPHTFNGKLEFNSHVHTMVTGGGLCGSSGSWVSRVYYERDPLMEAWRRAVIALLRAALRADQLCTKMTVDQMEEYAHPAGETLVEHQDSIVRGQMAFPAIRRSLRKAATHRAASHHLHRGANRQVLVQRQEAAVAGVEVQCSLEEFIDRWAQHIPEGYQHAVRSFGLFAPRALGQTSAAIFAILGQERRPRPKPRPWADSLKRDFGHDPLLDKTGKRMKWVRRMPPKASR